MYRLSGGAAIGGTSADTTGLFGATPVAQPAATNQAAVTTTAITAVTTTASSTASPVGFTTTAQADALVAAVNALITRAALMNTLLNQLRSDLVTLGGIKGSF